MVRKIVLTQKMRHGKFSTPRLHFVGSRGVSICERGMEFIFPYYMTAGTLVLNISTERGAARFDVIHHRPKGDLFRVKLRRNLDGLETSFCVSKAQMDCLTKNRVKSLEVKELTEAPAFI